MIRCDPELGTRRFAHETRLEIGFDVRECHAPCAIELQPSQIQSAARAERKAFDAVVAREAPARRPHMKLPGRGRQVSQRMSELFHFTGGDKRITAWATESGRQVRTPEEHLR